MSEGESAVVEENSNEHYLCVRAHTNTLTHSVPLDPGLGAIYGRWSFSPREGHRTKRTEAV